MTTNGYKTLFFVFLLYFFYPCKKNMSILKALIRVIYPGWSDFTHHQKGFEDQLFKTFDHANIRCFCYERGLGWCPPQKVEYTLEIPALDSNEELLKIELEHLAQKLHGESYSISYDL